MTITPKPPSTWPTRGSDCETKIRGSHPGLRRNRKSPQRRLVERGLNSVCDADRLMYKEFLRMKFQIVLAGAVVCGFGVASALAFPPMPTYLVDAYKTDKDYEPFLKTVEGLKMKCDVCHKPG